MGIFIAQVDILSYVFLMCKFKKVSTYVPKPNLLFAVLDQCILFCVHWLGCCIFVFLKDFLRTQLLITYFRQLITRTLGGTFFH